MNVPQKVIVDADVGSDDYLALLILLNAEALGNIIIVAIVCTMGNAARDAGCVNTMRLLETLGRTDIPVYRGALSPIVIAPLLEHYRGLDGLGDLEYNTFPNMSLVKNKPGSVAIGELVTQNPGKVTLICLGPLTNIALATRLYDNFAKLVQEIWIMGGAYTGVGNKIGAPTADWNFYVDPESAHIVLQSFTRKIYFVTRETGLANRVSFDWKYNVFGKATENNKALNLLTKVDKKIYASMEDQKWGPSDALLAAVFVNRRLSKKETKYSNATVELHGSLTRGQLILTKSGRAEENTITVIETLDLEGFKKLLLKL